MDMFWDRHFFLAYALAGASAVLSVTLAPWLMRRSMRKRGLAGVSRARRIMGCFLMGAMVPIGLLLLGAVGHPLLLAPGLAGAALLLLFVTKSPRLPWWGRHLGIILLCNFMYLTAFMMGLNRCRVVAKRSIDATHLKWIGTALLLYEDAHGVFPDDLRQLVDANFLSPNILLPAFTDTPKVYPEARPYSGPCEFTYVRLPDGAPGHLVWAWESPKYHDGEGTFVLYARGNVEWVTPAKLREELERTEAWLHEAQPRPLSAPASTASSPN